MSFSFSLVHALLSTILDISQENAHIKIFNLSTVCRTTSIFPRYSGMLETIQCTIVVAIVTFSLFFLNFESEFYAILKAAAVQYNSFYCDNRTISNATDKNHLTSYFFFVCLLV